MIADARPPATHRCMDSTGYREKAYFFTRESAQRHAHHGQSAYRCAMSGEFSHYHLTSK